MKDLATTSNGAPISLQGLCAGCFTQGCNGQATETGYCDVCTRSWVSYFVRKLRGAEQWSLTSPKWFQDELGVPADDILMSVSLDQAAALRLAVGRKLSPVLALNAVGVPLGQRDREAVQSLFGSLPTVNVTRVRRSMGWIAVALTWFLSVVALGALCGLCFGGRLQP